MQLIFTYNAIKECLEYVFDKTTDMPDRISWNTKDLIYDFDPATNILHLEYEWYAHYENYDIVGSIVLDPELNVYHGTNADIPSGRVDFVSDAYFTDDMEHPIFVHEFWVDNVGTLEKAFTQIASKVENKLKPRLVNGTC